MTAVQEIYNNLFRFESKNKSGYYPIHKKLNFEGAYWDILDWLFSKVEFKSTDLVLDVGCGTGYTLFRLNNEKRVSGLGISICIPEIEYAKKLAQKFNLGGKTQFEVADFDDPILNKYNKVIAIESLKHSVNIDWTLKNLMESISDGGLFIIVDDFVNKNSKLLEKQKELWEATSFIEIDLLKSKLSRNPNFHISDYDLTEHVRTRSLIKLFFLSLMINTLMIFTYGSLNRNLKTYLGGLQLEKLYAIGGNVSYKVLIGKKI